mgnify:CR=1 FL=1
MDVILGVIIGLAVGVLIGFLVKSGRSNSDSADNPLIKDLKEQLEREKNSTAAATKLTDELETMKKTVEKLTEAAGAADLRRVRAETEITEQVKSMASHNENLVKQTRAIAGALASSQTRGKFGEAHLEKLLESAGLIENEHFTRQAASEKIGDSGAIPDVTINMPGGSVIYIDSKFPFQRFYEAFETEDDALRKQLLVEHSKDLLAHIQALSKRNYADRGPSPDFVILYAPIDAIFIEAVKAIPDFLETSFRLGVTIATPTSMMALLRTIGNVYSRNAVSHNAENIAKSAALFMKDLTLLHTRIVKVGTAINSLSKAYGELIPTAQTTVKKAAKDILGYGVSGDKAKLAIAYPDAPAEVRELKNSEMIVDEDFIDAEEIKDEE